MTSATHHTAPASERKAPGERGLRTIDVVCISPQAWRTDLPTNRQQIMSRLAAGGHRVLFVESDCFLGRHLVRLLRGPGRRSLLRQLRGTEEAAPGVRVLTAPALVPWGHRFRIAARVNAALTSWAVRRRGDEREVVLWLYDPCFADCIGKIGERFAVYDCVDDYAEQSGDDPRKRALVSEYDRRAASGSRLVFATSRLLVERHLRVNANTHLVPNVGDYEHFAPAAHRSLAVDEVASLEAPVVGFVGNLLAEKIDFGLLESVAASRPDWTLVLVGPRRAHTEVALARLLRHENVRWLGPVPYELAPRYVAGFDVGLIPYLENEYTRSCFPLKTFEYLAAGKPVVASGLPELRGMEPHVSMVDGAAFVAAVEGALAKSSPADVAARQSVASLNTWETRAERLLELVASQL
jgi:glycosyltransferase involved in cell wall biosynthesis